MVEDEQGKQRARCEEMVSVESRDGRSHGGGWAQKRVIISISPGSRSHSWSPGPRPPDHVNRWGASSGNRCGNFVAAIHHKVPARVWRRHRYCNTRFEGPAEASFDAMSRCGRRTRLCANSVVEVVSNAKTVTGPPHGNGVVP